MKCNKIQNKWCVNKHGASKIIDTFETYHGPTRQAIPLPSAEVLGDHGFFLHRPSRPLPKTLTPSPHRGCL
jgi:hypothetical protein